MQANGIRPDQVTQVRGFADQRLRKPDAPLDPANRRISVIVQYLMKSTDEDESQVSSGNTTSHSASGPPEKTSESDGGHDVSAKTATK